MATDTLIEAAFASIANAKEDCDIVLYEDERTGDEPFEAELAAAAKVAGWDLIENEEGDLVVTPRDDD